MPSGDIVAVTDSSQESLHAAVARAGPGGKVSLSGVAEGDVAGARLRMMIAGLVDISGEGDFLQGSLPEHALGAGVPLSVDDDLVDEDELLERDGVPDAPARACDPGAGGARKPCKDCSCGLADIDAAAADAPRKEPGKGCGSCALGDAFRCAGCPYLGLPPFKPGERVELPSGLMTSDI